MKDLHLILTYFWFNEIKSGRKIIEYRESTQYWINRLNEKKFNNIIFHRAYTSIIMRKKWVKTDKINGLNTDLKIDKPVFAIYFIK